MFPYRDKSKATKDFVHCFEEYFFITNQGFVSANRVSPQMRPGLRGGEEAFRGKVELA